MTTTQQVGHYSDTVGPLRASLWSGTAQSRVDLHPPGAVRSAALAIAGGQQAGFLAAVTQSNPHACYWTGSAASLVDLHPASGALRSTATATDGEYQGGWVQWNSTLVHAALWHGTAGSLVDLNPSNATSRLLGMAPGQQVGYVNLGIGERAALWSGTPESFRNLHPAGAGISLLNATSGSAQVGYANTTAHGITAGIWFGTAESFTPLGPYLPPGYGWSSATSVTEHNGQFYVGGYATNFITGGDEAFLWIGVPAPGAWVALAGFAALMPRRRPPPR